MPRSAPRLRGNSAAVRSGPPAEPGESAPIQAGSRTQILRWPSAERGSHAAEGFSETHRSSPDVRGPHSPGASSDPRSVPLDHRPSAPRHGDHLRSGRAGGGIPRSGAADGARAARRGPAALAPRGRGHRADPDPRTGRGGATIAASDGGRDLSRRPRAHGSPQLDTSTESRPSARLPVARFDARCSPSPRVQVHLGLPRSVVERRVRPPVRPRAFAPVSSPTTRAFRQPWLPRSARPARANSVGGRRRGLPVPRAVRRGGPPAREGIAPSVAVGGG